MIAIKYQNKRPENSLKPLFGHCRMRVFIDNKRFVEIGRFSASAIDCLRLYRNIQNDGCLAKIGDFCEFAQCELLLGGEHKNQQIVNQVMTGCPPFRLLLERHGFDATHSSKGILTLGDGVIISRGASVLSGVNIGDGAVVAAGAMVVKNVPEFTFVGGVPAKIIGERNVNKEQARALWRMNLSELFSEITGKKLGRDMRPYNDENYLVIRMKDDEKDPEGRFIGYEILGVHRDGKFIRPNMQSPFGRYCSQVSLQKDDVAEWVADPFELEM